MGAIRFKSLLDTQSTPELVLGLSFFITFKIEVSVMEENLNRESQLSKYES